MIATSQLSLLFPLDHGELTLKCALCKCPYLTANSTWLKKFLIRQEGFNIPGSSDVTLRSAAASTLDLWRTTREAALRITPPPQSPSPPPVVQPWSGVRTAGARPPASSSCRPPSSSSSTLARPFSGSLSSDLFFFRQTSRDIVKCRCRLRLFTLLSCVYAKYSIDKNVLRCPPSCELSQSYSDRRHATITDCQGQWELEGRDLLTSMAQCCAKLPSGRSVSGRRPS